MMKRLLISTAAILFIISPSLVLAQLTSETYQVVRSSIGTENATINATSTNYDADQETGGLYILPSVTTSAEGGGGRAQTATIPAAPVVNSVVEALLVGPARSAPGAMVTLVVQIKSNHQATANDVVIFVERANGVVVTPPVTQFTDTLFTAAYRASDQGQDKVYAQVLGAVISEDTDGVSDGVLHLEVIETAPVQTPPAVATPVVPVSSAEPEAEESTDTSTYDISDQVQTDFIQFGVTPACNRAFSWEINEYVEVQRQSADKSLVSLARIVPTMPWFIDDEVISYEGLQYTFIGLSSGREQTVYFTPNDFLLCERNIEVSFALDIDADNQLEQYIEGVFQDVDGSSRPLAYTDDGVMLDTNFDAEPDTFWNPILGTSVVIPAADRLFVVDPTVSIAQEYGVAETYTYGVILRPEVSGALTSVNATGTRLAGRFAEEAKRAWWLIALTVTGFATGFVNFLLWAAGQPFSLTTITRVIPAAPRIIFGLVAFWRRRRAWGTVYDSVTKAPVDPVYVELLSTADGTSVASAITDLDGRYGFLVPQGTYEITAKKVNYLFPSQHRVLTSNDVLYSHLYYGGPIDVTDTVTFDIPLDPINFDWNQFEKMRTKQTHFIRRSDVWLTIITDVLFWFGAMALIWQFVSYPSWLTGLFLVTYLVMIGVRVYRGKPPLHGYITRKGAALPYALISIKRDGHEVLRRVADQFGRYIALVPKGDYTVEIQERINESEYQLVYEGRYYAKRGYINLVIKV